MAEVRRIEAELTQEAPRRSRPVLAASRARFIAKNKRKHAKVSIARLAVSRQR
jgi:hypothetical protein